MPQRTLIHADALQWLAAEGPLLGASVITSLPDVSGLPELGLQGWRDWFIAAAEATLAHTPDEGVTVFYQTDIKVEGRWIDKAFLCQLAAEREGSALLWHRIVCRRPPGSVSFGRPGYTHMLCFSRGVRDDVSRSLQDVLPQTGHMTWSRAMGTAACKLACQYVLAQTTTRTIVDPFCGRGTVLAVANAMGMDAVGVELSRRRVERARKLTIPGAHLHTAHLHAGD